MTWIYVKIINIFKTINCFWNDECLALNRSHSIPRHTADMYLSTYPVYIWPATYIKFTNTRSLEV